jgi:hypothetical protein
MPTAASAPATSTKKDYKGFVGGIFSGIAKLSGKSIAAVLISLKYLAITWIVAYSVS